MPYFNVDYQCSVTDLLSVIESFVFHLVHPRITEHSKPPIGYQLISSMKGQIICGGSMHLFLIVLRAGLGYFGMHSRVSGVSHMLVKVASV